MKQRTVDYYSTKRVSYILVTKNRAKMLEKTLLRANILLTPKDELIIVDGFSTDNTLRVVKKYKNIVSKFISEPDISPSHAANKGILVARGKYLKYLTDDDIVYPKQMEKAIQVMETNPNIDLIICGGTRYRSRTKKLQIVYNPPGTNFGNNVDDAFKHGVNAMGYVIRRKSLAKIGLIPTDVMADQLFMINCLKLGARVKFCRIKLYHQFIHNLTINETQREIMAIKLFQLVKLNASKRFFIRFAINWFFWEHPKIKKLLFVPLYAWKYAKLYSKPKNQIKSPKRTTYIWDGGFS